MAEPYRNPLPTVDIIIEVKGGIVLIERKNPPHGWAIPGGFVDYGESVEACAVREAREETGLNVRLKDLLTCIPGRTGTRGTTPSPRCSLPRRTVCLSPRMMRRRPVFFPPGRCLFPWYSIMQTFWRIIFNVGAV